MITADNLVVHKPSKILSLRELTSSTFVLRFERRNLHFEAGQYLSIGIKGDYNTRAYSIYSSMTDDYLEVLVKEVEDGYLSGLLKHLQLGDELDVHGPKGHFILNKDTLENSKYLFISSGTGISPFHSFVKTFPKLDYKLLHGVRKSNEAYDRKDYDADKHILCTSRDKEGDFHGRITDYLKVNKQNPENTLVYLCGNSQMINDSVEILKGQGFERGQFYAEIYF